VVSSCQVRDIAKATGPSPKTDAADARLLAWFAEVVRPARCPLPNARTQQLVALITRRRQLVEMLTADKNRRGSAPREMRR